MAYCSRSALSNFFNSLALAFFAVVEDFTVSGSSRLRFLADPLAEPLVPLPFFFLAPGSVLTFIFLVFFLTLTMGSSSEDSIFLANRGGSLTAELAEILFEDAPKLCVCVVSEGCDCEVVPIYARKVEGKLLLETQQQLATAEKFLVGCGEPSSDLGIGRADGKQLVNVDERRNITSSRFHILPLKTNLFSAKEY